MPVRIKYTKELLEPVVISVYSWAALLDHFGKQKTGGNYNAFQRRCVKFKIDTSHFKGQGWSKGLSAQTNPAVAAVRRKVATVLKALKAGDIHERVHGTRLRTFLLDSGIKYVCSIPTCGISTWCGTVLSLDVDHINGNNKDQRLENLRFICPNCHRQTATWGSKNRKS